MHGGAWEGSKLDRGQPGFPGERGILMGASG